MNKRSHSQSHSRPINKATMDEPQEEFIAPDANTSNDEKETEAFQQVQLPVTDRFHQRPK
jgi:hypothetical protein